MGLTVGTKNNSGNRLGMLANIFNLLGLAWWVEITTTQPRCIYYFGPFTSAGEAHKAKPGYIEDLEQEGAEDIQATVKRCKPKDLTVFDEPEAARSLSGQLR